MGFNESDKKGCAAWNSGNHHQAKYVDASGKCMFFHGCDQFVTDKGAGGQCLGPHKRSECDYDPAKKCSKPHKFWVALSCHVEWREEAASPWDPNGCMLQFSGHFLEGLQRHSPVFQEVFDCPNIFIPFIL